MPSGSRKSPKELAREKRAEDHKKRMNLPLAKRQKLNLARREVWERGAPARKLKRETRLEGYRVKNEERKRSRVIA